MRRLNFDAVVLFAVCFLAPSLLAQSASSSAVVRTSVHGIVHNAATGQPLARALVRIEGDADAGILTDNEGRFEFPSVPVGPQAIEVRKPGFRDLPANADAALDAGDSVGPAHNVIVDTVMPDLIFTLSPACAIRGQLRLSTGDPASGIHLNLLRRSILDGRAAWTSAAITKTNSEGFYRFGELGAGSYVIYTEPAMDSETATDSVTGEVRSRPGYASVFYPDARELSGAAIIKLKAGDVAQADLSLQLETFHAVSAAIAAQQSDSGLSFSAIVFDGNGHQLPYRASYDTQTHAVKALLPDGSYSLYVSTKPSARRNDEQAAEALVGAVSFDVAGHTLTKLRIPLVLPHPQPVDLTLLRSGQSTANHNGPTMVMLSPAGEWINAGMVSAYAYAYTSAEGSMPAAHTVPGSYWVHTQIAQKGFCEDSFTAGGASLARDPLSIGLSGSTAPLQLTLRDDCAKLTLSLPANLTAINAGEEPYYTVYVVPEFDSITDLQPVTLRASTGGAITLANLTPGSYRVYTFDAPMRLEYRNPSALAALPIPGQQITLSEGDAGNLVLEVPGH